MKLRAFAAAWTLFTALAAPALLSAAEEPAALPPAPDPAAQPPPLPAVEPAPAPPVAEQPATEPDAGYEQRQAAAEVGSDEAKAATGQDSRPASPKRKPVARTAASATVTIKDFEFAPSSVTINVGDTVTWTNQGPTVHTATGSGFDTGNLSKGESGSHTFASAGTFDYICTPHPFMKGTVTVAAASGDSGDDAGSGGAGESAAAGDDGPSLPDTGADAWVLALIGTGLLSLGVAVRRRSPSA